MTSTTAAYPASHEEARERVMQVIDLIAANPLIPEEELVAALVQTGVGDVDARLLALFVPMAMTFALLKLMGLKKFPSSYQARNAAGQWVELPLATEHYFSAALVVGYDVTTQGYTERISKAVFQAVISRSAEMGAVNQYFESGGTREGLAESTLGPPALIGITYEQITASR